MTNYFAILGVKSSISNNNLRARIIEIAEDCHPNSPKFNNQSQHDFIAAFIAFDVLINPTNRLVIRRIECAKVAGLKEDDMISELQILQTAEDDARAKSQSIVNMSLHDFKEMYNPNFLVNLLKIILRFGS